MVKFEYKADRSAVKKERLGCRSFLGNEKMKNYFVNLFDDEFIVIRNYDKSLTTI